MATQKRSKKGFASKHAWQGFAFGGIASCVAETATMPFDVIKTRLQVSGSAAASTHYSGFFDCALRTARGEGLAGLFAGLSPALLRQLTYGSLRYGLYEPVKRAVAGPDGDPNDLSVGQKIVCGVACGGVASAVFTPTDLIKVRMQSGGAGYPGIGAALRAIVAEGGVRGLYTGVSPTVQRAMLVAGAELAMYDVCKSAFLDRGLIGDHIGLHFAASFVAGFFAVLVGSPADVIKSRVMSQPVGADGRGLLYASTLDCLRKSVREEGVLSLWNGFGPNYGRYAPNVVITFLVLEQLRELSYS